MIDKILKLYPDTYAIYDLGKYIGISRPKESFYLLNKQDLSVTNRLAMYSREAVELIENAIPIWYKDDAD